MPANPPVLNWLRFHQIRDGVVNSYYFSLVSKNLRRGGFEIPPFILEEELEKEDVEIGPSSISYILRDFVVHLLKFALPHNQSKILYSNYNDYLRDFLNHVGVLPNGVANPLLPNKSFHSLSAEVKLFIIYQLIQQKGPTEIPKEIGMDSHLNRYFLVDGGKLYIQYGKQLKEMTKDDDKSGMQLTPLEDYVRKESWKLMADTAKMWRNVAVILENFDEVDIFGKILNKRETAKEEMISDAQKDSARREFNQYLDRIRPTPQPRTTYTQNKASNSSSKLDPPPAYKDLPRNNAPVDKKTSPTHTPNKTNKKRCMHFPACQKKDSTHLAEFHHPTEPCPHFKDDNCPNGLFCRYIHPKCPKGKNCTGFECQYEHSSCRPTLLRIFNAKMEQEQNNNSQTQNIERESTRNNMRNNEDRRRGRSTEPLRNSRGRSQSRGRPVDNREDPNSTLHNPPQNGRRDPSAHARRQPANSQNPLPFSKKDLRCHYYPRCKNPADQCDYTHPTQRCEAFPNCDRGRDCPFLHGDCSKDGYCNSEYCPYEHRNQQPPRAAANYQRYNTNRNDNMSSNMSTSGSRR